MKKRLPESQPSRNFFVEYARSRGIETDRAGDQWDIWDAGDWCDGNDTPIKNWKLKLVTFAKMGYGAFGDRARRRGMQGPDDIRAAEIRARESDRLRKQDEQKRQQS